MSRVAKQPVVVPSSVAVTLNGQSIEVKGSKGTLSRVINSLVKIEEKDGVLSFSANGNAKAAWAQAGTARALVNNMVVGVEKGFERKLTLIGVGYRAQVQGNKLNLTLGFSHPILHELPKGVSAVVNGQTEIVLSSNDKQLVGQVAADVRAYRSPEPYKGKGVRYADEQISLKETKKK